MSRLTRDGTAESVSRDQIPRHERGQGNAHFPCSADHEQDWQPCPVDPYSAICDDHIHLHATALCTVVVLFVQQRCSQAIRSNTAVLVKVLPLNTSSTKKNLNASVLLSISPSRGKNVKTFRWDHISLAAKRKPLFESPHLTEYT